MKIINYILLALLLFFASCNDVPMELRLDDGAFSHVNSCTDCGTDNFETPLARVIVSSNLSVKKLNITGDCVVEQDRIYNGEKIVEFLPNEGATLCIRAEGCKPLFVAIPNHVVNNSEYYMHILYVESKVKNSEDNPITSEKYLTFTAQEPNSSVGIKNEDNNPDIEYSIDGCNTWQKLTEQDSVVLRNVGDKMFVRGNNPDGFSTSFVEHTSFKMSGKIAASGSVMCLIDGNGEALSIPSGEYCFFRLFQDCTSLTVAPELPATTLAEGCYESMFDGCTSLTVAPELPATILARYCYFHMFYGCTSLSTAPELSAANLDGYCYGGMFFGCTSLAVAPELPATNLAEGCYIGMFYCCESLQTAPQLPATILANSCYSRMFKYCTSLSAAPDLPAKNWKRNYYESMFYGCTSLTTPPKLPDADWVDSCYESMFFDNLED